MMKNKMMRVASVLLVAVLLSTCTISGTFAKYVTENNAQDNARVAKFGVVIQADGALYGTYYDTRFLPTTDDTAANLLVQSSVVGQNAENVVAPGTKNTDGLYFSLTGAPEVRTELTVTITSENIFLKNGTYAVMVPATSVSATSWKEDTYYTEADGVYTVSTSYNAQATYYTMENVATVNDEFYYPVVYSATIDEFEAGDYTVDTLNAIAAKYADLFVAEDEDNQGTPNANISGTPETTTTTTDCVTTYTVTVKYNPNFDYSTLEANGETITWAWAFDGANDEADTILANLMAGAAVVKVGNTIEAPVENTDYHLATSFSIEIGVEQVND